MADWNEDSEQLRANVVRVLSDARDDARARIKLSLAAACKWHREIMRGLSVPERRYVGRFRGESGLEHCEVAVGLHRGVPATDVANALKALEAKLSQAVALLDEIIAPNHEQSADQLTAVLDLCAWAHSEWIRIHPFANGNGRVARLWVNVLAMRYGLRPFLPLRPRPSDDYGAACAAAMDGDWRPTARVFRRMYRDAILR